MRGKSKSEAVIVAGGDLAGAEEILSRIPADAFIIAADRGVDVLLSIGKTPDLLVGDMDSAISQWESVECEKILLPVEKDESDTEKAFQIAVDRGLKKVTLIGGLGSRIDHVLANLEVVTGFFRRGIAVSMEAEKHSLFWIDENRPLTISRREGMGISLLPLEPIVLGVTTTGLYYPLQNEPLYQNQSRGISNKWVENSAEVTVERGVLLAILYTL